MGGTWTSLSGLGGLFTMLFSYNLLMSSLINKLYFFNAKFPEERKKKEIIAEQQRPLLRASTAIRKS
jgi:hypothetical protein